MQDRNDDLSRICIRAKVDSGWESVTLRELLDAGKGGIIARWFTERIYDVVGLEEGVVVNENQVLAMVRFLESNVGPLVRFRPDHAVEK